MPLRRAQQVPDSASDRRDWKIPGCDPESSQLMSLTKLVDCLGFGPAQMRVLALSSFAVFFCDGCELSLLPLISKSIAQGFGLGAYEEALMLTACLFGLMVGNLLSGYIGDFLGRRPAILLSLATTAMLGYVSSIVMDYPSLIVARCLLGIGMGIGMGPSMVRVSENCPEPFRVFCQGARTMPAASFGPLLVTVLCGYDDPHLQELNWRRLIVVVATLPALFFIVGFVFLSESPVWLACIGQHNAARAGFADVREQNSAHGVPVNYEPPPISKCEQLGTWDQLQIIFSPHTWLMTCSLIGLSFLTNMVIYGDGYALAQVLPDISHVPAAWQLALRAGFSALWIVLATWLAQSMPRKQAIIFAVLAVCAGCFTFSFAGSVQHPRSLGHEALFQCGTNMIAFAQFMLGMLIYQAAVEIYPPNAASTGSALIIATGRVGCISAPVIFEHLRHVSGSWVTFYIVIGFLSFACAAAFALVPSVEPFRPGESDLSTLGEFKKLEDGTKATRYGAAGGALAAVGS